MTRASFYVGAMAAGLLMTTAAAVGDDSSKQDKSPGTITGQKEGTYNSKDLRTVTLTVKEVDAKKHRVIFEATVTPEANVTSSGQPIKLDQLKEGDTVRASFDPKTGDVVRVDVTPAK
jgi:hypothetical protein